jgi:hypothetical protein
VIWRGAWMVRRDRGVFTSPTTMWVGVPGFARVRDSDRRTVTVEASKSTSAQESPSTSPQRNARVSIMVKAAVSGEGGRDLGTAAPEIPTPGLAAWQST